MSNIEFKKCSNKKCTDPIKTLDCFSKNKNASNGHSLWCKECKKIYNKEHSEENKKSCRVYRIKNKDKINLYTKNYRKNNKEKLSEITKRYYLNHKDDILQRNSQYEKRMKKNCLEHSLWKKAKYRAKGKNINFDITVEDIIIPKKCPILNIDLIVADNKRTNNSPSLDRIDNNKGYTPDNIIVISWRANKLKSDSTLEELEKIVNFYKKL